MNAKNTSVLSSKEAPLNDMGPFASTRFGSDFATWRFDLQQNKTRIGLVVSLCVLLAFGITDSLLGFDLPQLTLSRFQISPALGLLFVWSYRCSNTRLFDFLLSLTYITFAYALLMYTAHGSLTLALYGLGGAFCTVAVLQTTINPPVSTSIVPITALAFTALTVFHTANTTTELLLISTFISLLILVVTASILNSNEKLRYFRSEQRITSTLKEAESLSELNAKLLKHEIGNQLVAFDSSLTRMEALAEHTVEFEKLRKRTINLHAFIDDISSANKEISRPIDNTESTLFLTLEFDEVWRSLGLTLIGDQDDCGEETTTVCTMRKSGINDLAFRFIKQSLDRALQITDWNTSIKRHISSKDKAINYELIPMQVLSTAHMIEFREQFNDFAFAYAQTVFKQNGYLVTRKISDKRFVLQIKYSDA